MRRVELVPVGFPIELHECPVGLFYFGETLCLKTEYDGDVYIINSGECFWGGTANKLARAKLTVQPVDVKDYKVTL